MKPQKSMTLALIAFLSVPIALVAQSKLAQSVKSPEDVKVLMDFPKEGRNAKNGKGFSANISLLPNGIKKVGLVSFFAFDPGVTRTWTTRGETATTITTTTYTKKRSTGGLAADIAAGAAAVSIDPMIKNFKQAGIDLVLPQDFLDNDDKKNYYNSFVAQKEKFADWLNNMGSGNHDIMYGIPEPFIMIDIVGEPYANYTKKGLVMSRSGKVSDNQIFLFDKDTKLTESIGYDLCSKLGLDAVIVTYMTIFMPSKDKIQLQNIRMVMFGPNPVMPEGESKHGMIPHVRGQFYVGVSANPEEVIYDENKKDPESMKLNFNGFDHIYVAMVRKMVNYIKESNE